MQAQPVLAEGSVPVGPASATDTSWIEVTADSPPAVRLAFQDLGSMKVPRVAVKRYDEYLDRLSRECHAGKSELARVAASSVLWLDRRVEEEISTLRFLREFTRAIGDPLHGAPDCAGQAASILVGMGSQELRESEMEALKMLMQQKFGRSG